MRESKEARPFLKWAGGKRQLLPVLLEQCKLAQPFDRYHEPFLGGGALFFALYREGMLGTKKTYLSDTNASLIRTYQAVQQSVEDVVDHLRLHKEKHSHEYYYEMRANV